MNELSEKVFDVISVIASRKAEFYLATKLDLNKQLANLFPTIDPIEADSQLRKAISELDNTLFLSDKEKTSKRINPELSVSELNMSEEQKQTIANMIFKAITKIV